MFQHGSSNPKDIVDAKHSSAICNHSIKLKLQSLKPLKLKLKVIAINLVFIRKTKFLFHSTTTHLSYSALLGFGFMNLIRKVNNGRWLVSTIQIVQNMDIINQLMFMFIFHRNVSGGTYINYATHIRVIVDPAPPPIIINDFVVFLIFESCDTPWIVRYLLLDLCRGVKLLDSRTSTSGARNGNLLHAKVVKAVGNSRVYNVYKICKVLV